MSDTNDGFPNLEQPVVDPKTGRVSPAWYRFFVTLFRRGSDSRYIGEVMLWAPAHNFVNGPPGWLRCDGSQVSRTSFAALFALIYTSFGPGDGSTTFNLPSYGLEYWIKAL